MTEDKKIVEVTATNDGGKQVPVGIMNTKQALSLPQEMDISVSHPDREASADEFIGRDELRLLTEPWTEPVGFRFPAPISEDSADRLVEAKAAARNVLEEIIASGNEAGWATREMVVALIEAANSLNDAASADPDPADDPDVSDAVQEQIGHEEQFD
ncbi:hypothetical protein [Rhizobium fabae]|uniref:Uncharacterized protein n=1 Tax=Rhizobium fabae TaxID=573179 RepID=A0A7W6BDF1_9HYPH|nr:hypothetical protein [Rhizobium fabae]